MHLSNDLSNGGNDYTSSAVPVASPLPSECLSSEGNLAYPCYSELSPPFLDPRIDVFFPPGSRLRESEFPIFHAFLKKHGRGDLSWKIDACAQGAHRLDCWELPQHTVMVPLSCGRRTCPDCGRRIMSESIRRYRGIMNIWSGAEAAQTSYRVRFWTFTCSHPRRMILKPIFESLSAAIRSWWRITHGNRSGFEDCGGLFSLECGISGNVHAHALIYGPFLRVEESRAAWGRALSRVGLSGNRIEVKPVTSEGGIIETIAYPLDPEKRKDLDEELLANIELSLSGRRAGVDKAGKELVAIPATRRQWCAGSWVGKFERVHSSFACPHCLAESGHISGMTVDPDLDFLHGKPYQRDYFRAHPERWEEWNQGVELNRKIRGGDIDVENKTT